MNTVSPIRLEDLASQLESKRILKELIVAHRHLAELKGISKTIPNDGHSLININAARSSG